ncbi:MAG: BamA/TamA family outer membrane protein [Paludibacteraceae bacterium]
MLLLAGACVSMRAASLDSLMNLPAMGVPIVNYSPETGWEFGAAAQGYFRLPDQSRTSIVQLDGAYSLKRQWYVNAQGSLYMGRKTPWMLLFRGGYRHYPDVYYARGNGGNNRPKQGVAYNSQRGYVHLQPLILLPRQWYIGPVFDFLYERTDLSIAVPDALMWGIGAVLQYDSRDVLFYPHRGLFFKLTATHYDTALGSTARLTRIQTDLRQFVPIYRDLVFAWQLRTEWSLAANGGEAVPFQLLPTFGGQDLLRGVARNMYRDNAMLALQAELRIPIWNLLRACVFAGVGDVYNTQHWQWATPKVGYGLGLRIGINRAKVNIRFDVARNNIYKEWNTWQSYSFYLTATEAF